MWNIFALDVAMNPKGGKREEGRVFTVREKKREGRKGGDGFQTYQLACCARPGPR